MIFVPELEEPEKFPVFFNPRGKFVRDVSIICYKAYLDSNQRSPRVTFADSLAGVGARGLRVAKEVEGIDSIFLNDINSRALEMGRRSAALNSIEHKCTFSRREACSFLLSRAENSGERFDITDVDPFGTPSDYIDCAIRSVKDGGLLSITATDSAVLCGVYPEVALRKYLALPIRTEYSHEVGLRLLFGLAAQMAMRLETGIEPMFCHHNMHYFRAYLKVKVGNPYSRANEKKLGFILHCFNCGSRRIKSREEYFMQRTKADIESETSKNPREVGCPSCGKRRLAVAGPLWIGGISSPDFEAKCRSISELSVFNPELANPLYYDVNLVKLGSGLSMPKIGRIVAELNSRGYPASRTRLNPNGVRTDATKEVLREIVLELAR